MSTTTARSRSRTFRGPGEPGAPAVAGLPGVRRNEVSPVRVLETERYDTSDLRLAAAGITLAVVRGAAPAVWQLDMPDDGRSERLRVPVTGDDPALGRTPVPPEIIELVRGVARKRTVRPVGRVRTLRAEHRLVGDDDRTLAVVVHDHVTLSTLGRATEVEAWTEMTVEPQDADADLLEQLTGRVREVGLRPAAPQAEAELARLLRPVSTHRPELPRSSAGGAVTAFVAAQAARLRDAVDALLAEPPLLARAARPAQKELTRHVGRAARRLEKAVAAATSAGSDAAVHTARKAAKRLRYVSEVARPVGGKDAKRFVRSVKSVQQALGDHQDAVVAGDALRTLGALAHAEGENGFGFGVLHGHDTATAQRIEADLPDLWKRTWTARNRRWLR